MKTHCKRNHEFTPENTRIDRRGHRVCRTCQRDHHERWKQRNPGAMSEAHRRSRRRRGTLIAAYEKTPKERARRASAKRRLRATDPAWAARERERARQRRQQPRVREQAREASNRWRALQAAAPGAAYCTQEKIDARRAMYGGRCAYCGAPDATEIDHVIPLSRGGTAFPANIVSACRSCNGSKSGRTLAEWGRRPSLAVAA